MKRILIARGGAMGDFILTLPVLAALRERWPEARITVLGYPGVGALALAGRLADEAVSIEEARWAGLFSEDGNVSEATAAWLNAFDLVITYLKGGNFEKYCKQVIHGIFRPDDATGIPASMQLLKALQPWGITEADAMPKLVLPGERNVENRIACHVGSGSAKKNWPKAQWEKLLVQLNRPLLLIGGEAEGDRCARLAANLANVEIAQNLPLVELAKRMQRCAGFVGHDSGITHLAAALDMSGVVIWRDSPFATWRPMSTKLKVLHEPTVQAVMEAITTSTPRSRRAATKS